MADASDRLSDKSTSRGPRRLLDQRIHNRRSLLENTRIRPERQIHSKQTVSRRDAELQTNKIRKPRWPRKQRDGGPPSSITTLYQGPLMPERLVPTTEQITDQLDTYQHTSVAPKFLPTSPTSSASVQGSSNPNTHVCSTEATSSSTTKALEAQEQPPSVNASGPVISSLSISVNVIESEFVNKQHFMPLSVIDKFNNLLAWLHETTTAGFDRDHDTLEYTEMGISKRAYRPLTKQRQLTKALHSCQGSGLILRITKPKQWTTFRLNHQYKLRELDSISDSDWIPHVDMERSTSEAVEDSLVLMTGGKTPEPNSDE
ncbi:hypothetical protein BJ508DRAFT_314227 [Ascobolus immersus RN42]|uniref:Uncharacterized protein n=1 Tax=Ascobolus immersus RN42 TaxID=1160509 RepID=A0A3N4HM90_ASCIM|nr:hypothetical protein BJ508DRAFT_314227 [Ascobolus immersus RN42]